MLERREIGAHISALIATDFHQNKLKQPKHIVYDILYVTLLN